MNHNRIVTPYTGLKGIFFSTERMADVYQQVIHLRYIIYNKYTHRESDSQVQMDYSTFQQRHLPLEIITTTNKAKDCLIQRDLKNWKVREEATAWTGRVMYPNMHCKHSVIQETWVELMLCLNKFEISCLEGFPPKSVILPLLDFINLSPVITATLNKNFPVLLNF